MMRLVLVLQRRKNMVHEGGSNRSRWYYGLMFRYGYSIARQFTLPVVLSRRTVGGACSAGIGTFIVINDDGWILTAGHIVDQINRLGSEAAATEAYQEELTRLRADPALDKRERQRRIARLHHPQDQSTQTFSAWWARDGAIVAQAAMITAVDLAVAKIENYERGSIKTYPTFKDPTKDFEPGTSLCKLGFPFHNIEPLWNSDTKAFEFPPGSLPLPLFPIEGMFTRVAMTPTPAGSPPFSWVETSSPGLRGQSGGPTFDQQGTVWAVQVQTAHYPLGFSAAGLKEEQYLNVGLGVSTATILPVLDSLGVKYNVSAY